MTEASARNPRLGQDAPRKRLRIGLAVAMIVSMIVVLGSVPIFGVSGNFAASVAAPLGIAVLVMAIGVGVADRRTGGYFGRSTRRVLLVVGLASAVVGLGVSTALR